MIPKIIHLCWFGYGEYSDLIKMCIDSWHIFLPDYEIMVWNEKTFDVNHFLYTRQAYNSKKWAFVSDFARLYALNKYGGVYMDTDLEVIQDFSQLLFNERYVSSFAEGHLLTAGFIACEKKHPFITKLLDYYRDMSFLDDKGNEKLIMNPLIFTKIGVRDFGLDIGCKEIKNEFFHIYPMDYFMPFVKNINNNRWKNRKYYHITQNTYTIHHDMGSWDNKNKLSFLLKRIARTLFREKIYNFLKYCSNKKQLNSIE